MSEIISKNNQKKGGAGMRKRYLVQSKDKKYCIPLELFLQLLVDYKILTKEERDIALRTLVLPDDILVRLKIAENSNRN